MPERTGRPIVDSAIRLEPPECRLKAVRASMLGPPSAFWRRSYANLELMGPSLSRKWPCHRDARKAGTPSSRVRGRVSAEIRKAEHRRRARLAHRCATLTRIKFTADSGLKSRFPTFDYSKALTAPRRHRRDGLKRGLDQIGHGANPVSQPKRHGGRHAHGFMRPAQILECNMEADRRKVAIDLL